MWENLFISFSTSKKCHSIIQNNRTSSQTTVQRMFFYIYFDDTSPQYLTVIIELCSVVNGSIASWQCTLQFIATGHRSPTTIG
jgi:hypothetical protein